MDKTSEALLSLAGMTVFLLVIRFARIALGEIPPNIA